jgi:3-deoxy-D-manno-octulosonic-acid transferase
LALINTPDEMTSTLSAWLTDNEARKAAGSACQEIVTKNAGAVKNTLAFIQQVYP